MTVTRTYIQRDNEHRGRVVSAWFQVGFNFALKAHTRAQQSRSLWCKAYMLLIHTAWHTPGPPSLSPGAVSL